MNALLRLGLGCLGILLLLVALKTSWVEVPVGFEHDGESFQPVCIQPESTSFFRIGNALLVFVCLAFGLFPRTKAYASVAAAVWCALLLMYPWAVMRTEDEISARAHWLHDQHTNLTWLGGDASLAMERNAHVWKGKLYLVDPPEFETVPDVPRWQPWESGAEHLPRLVDWLGYSNAFCQFCRKGWFASVMGCLCAFVFVASDKRGIEINRARRSAIAFLSTFALFVVAIALHEFSVGQKINRAASAYQDNDFAFAIENLRIAQDQSVSIRTSGAVVTQMGVLERLIGRQTWRSSLAHANLLEREGRYPEAEDIYRQLMLDEALSWSDQKEGCRGLLRIAIHKLNSGNERQATALLEEILKFDPSNLKANYALQLSCVRLGDRDRLQSLVEQLAAIYGRFRFPNKKVVLASGHQNLLFLAIQENDVESSWTESLKMRSP